MIALVKWYRRLRREGAGRREAAQESKGLVKRGLAPDFELPYPCPRNEHEDGMNWAAVNGVMSGRSDW